MPARVQVFTTEYCAFCVRAKALLTKRKIAFEEIDLTNDPHGRSLLVKASGGRRTVPQIFIDGAPIGGHDELYDLDRRGELLRMIAA